MTVVTEPKFTAKMHNSKVPLEIILLKIELAGRKVSMADATFLTKCVAVQRHFGALDRRNGGHRAADHFISKKSWKLTFCIDGYPLLTTLYTLLKTSNQLYISEFYL